MYRVDRWFRKWFEDTFPEIHNPSLEATIKFHRMVHLVGVCLVLIIAHATPLQSQPAAASDRWKVSAEFSFTDQSGNKVLRLLTGGLKVTHLQEDAFELDSTLRTRYGKSEGELVAFSHTASLAFDFRPRETWSPFLFADATRDELKRLDVRLSSGVGMKRTLYREANNEASLSLATLYSFEQISAEVPEEGSVRLAAERAHHARWSVRGRFRYDLRENVTLNHMTFYQPVWDEMANYLLRSDTGLKVLLTERLALSVEYQIQRESQPPNDVAPNDLLLTTGLIIDF